MKESTARQSQETAQNIKPELKLYETEKNLKLLDKRYFMFFDSREGKISFSHHFIPDGDDVDIDHGSEEKDLDLVCHVGINCDKGIIEDLQDCASTGAKTWSYLEKRIKDLENEFRWMGLEIESFEFNSKLFIRYGGSFINRVYGDHIKHLEAIKQKQDKEEETHSKRFKELRINAID